MDRAVVQTNVRDVSARRACGHRLGAFATVWGCGSSRKPLGSWAKGTQELCALFWSFL